MVKASVRNHRRGMTIVELLIVTGLFGIIMLGTHQLVINGIRYYNESMDSLDIQREALIGLSRLNSELENSHRNRMIAGIAPVSGIVYPSIFDATQDFETDADGRTLWQGVRCCYVGTLGNGVPAILQHHEVLPGGPNDTPPNPYSYDPWDLAYFSALGPGKTVARNVEVFEPVLQTDTVEITLVVSLTTRHKSSMTLRSKAIPRN